MVAYRKGITPGFYMSITNGQKETMSWKEVAPSAKKLSGVPKDRYLESFIRDSHGFKSLSSSAASQNDLAVSYTHVEPQRPRP